VLAGAPTSLISGGWKMTSGGWNVAAGTAGGDRNSCAALAVTGGGASAAGGVEAGADAGDRADLRRLGGASAGSAPASGPVSGGAGADGETAAGMAGAWAAAGSWPPASGWAPASSPGEPAGRISARRALRSSLRPCPPVSWPSGPGAGPSLSDCLFSRSVSSIRAISPVRLPGARSRIRALRATRELFVRAQWDGARRFGALRIQARCLFLALRRALPFRQGHFRRGPRGPGGLSDPG
jgi:hypothetical protein